MTTTDLGMARFQGRPRVCAIGIAMLVLALTGCTATVPPDTAPPVVLSDFEAPPRDLIRVENSSYSHLIRLDRMGAIGKAERDRLAAFIINVGANHPESLRVELRGPATPAQLRSVADLLVDEGVDPKYIVRADLRSGPRAPGGTIIVAVERAIAVLPNCPGWISHVSAPEDNLPNPNFGCSDVGNLAAMIGDPHHLREGASSIYTDAEVAAIGVSAYRADKIKELPRINPFSTTPGAQ
jgi:pilus biogenesis lipoprotein CpaD